MFEIDDDGNLVVLLNERPEALREALIAAAAGCPTGAITVVD